MPNTIVDKEDHVNVCSFYKYNLIDGVSKQCIKYHYTDNILCLVCLANYIFKGGPDIVQG